MVEFFVGERVQRLGFVLREGLSVDLLADCCGCDKFLGVMSAS